MRSSPHLRRGLKGLQVLLNLLLPLYAFWITIQVGATFPFDSPIERWLIEVGIYYFPFVLIFIGFMQLLLVGGMPDDPRLLARDLLGPLLIMSGQALLEWDSLRWYLFELGALYASSMMLAYALLVWGRPVLEGKVWQWSMDELGSYLVAALLQLIFLLPAAFSIYLFSKILIVRELAGGFQGTLSILLYLGLLGYLAWAEYEWMKPHAISL